MLDRGVSGFLWGLSRSRATGLELRFLMLRVKGPGGRLECSILVVVDFLASNVRVLA